MVTAASKDKPPSRDNEVKEVTAFRFAGVLYADRTDAELARARADIWELSRDMFGDTDFDEDAVDTIIIHRRAIIEVLTRYGRLCGDVVNTYAQREGQRDVDLATIKKLIECAAATAGTPIGLIVDATAALQRLTAEGVQ